MHADYSAYEFSRSGAVYAPKTPPVHAMKLAEQHEWYTEDNVRMVGSPGDYLINDNGKEWVVKEHLFKKTYRDVGGGQYLKTARVYARQADSGLALAVPESVIEARPGDWVVSDMEGNSWVMPDHEFTNQYEYSEPSPYAQVLAEQEEEPAPVEPEEEKKPNPAGWIAGVVAAAVIGFLAAWLAFGGQEITDEDLEDRAAELDERESELDTREGELDEREDAIEDDENAAPAEEEDTSGDDAREEELDEREEELDERESGLDSRSEELDERSGELDTRESTVEERESDASTRESDLDDREEELDDREEELDNREQELENQPDQEDAGDGEES